MSKSRWIIGASAGVGIAALLYFLPLFHVVPLHGSEARNATGNSTADSFDPVALVDKLWDDQLIPAANKAVDASQLVAEIKADRDKTRQAHGRSLGLGDTYYFFTSGKGRVLSVEKNSIELSIDDTAETDIVLETGIIFGNAVRDGSGLLDVNNFNNSRQFNAISTEINRRIESDVLPELRKQATVGATIRFAGCAEINDEDADLHPLRVVPIIGEMP